MTAHRFEALLIASALALAACQSEPASSSTSAEPATADGASEAAVEASQTLRVADDAAAAKPRLGFERVLAWGEGHEAVGWRAPAEDFVGDGPSGLAVRADGAVLLADRLRGRLLEIDASGVRVLAAIPEDATTLALSERGAIALYSARRSLVWIHAPSGELAAELVLPRIVGDVVRIGFDAHERVYAETTLQSRFTIGSANAPLDEASVLRSMQPGVATSSSERTLTTIRESDGKCFLVESARRGERLEELRRLPIATDAASLRLVGLDGDRALALVERTRDGAPSGEGTPMIVDSELVLVSLDSGRLLGKLGLPARGLWSPRQAMALGGGHVAWMRAEAEGLRIVSMPLGSLTNGGAK